jgi:hypothetical protein
MLLPTIATVGCQYIEDNFFLASQELLEAIVALRGVSQLRCAAMCTCTERMRGNEQLPWRRMPTKGKRKRKYGLTARQHSKVI